MGLELLEDRRLLDGFPLVPAGAAVSYRVPTVGDDPLAWTAPDFDDSDWTDTTIVGGPSLVITEIDAGEPDWVEIQNVSDWAINTSGWFVALNDASSVNINDVNPLVWLLPTEIAARSVLYKTDDSDDDAYFGGDIVWDIDHGWAMIADGDGNVIDFVVWGYSEAEIASFDVSVGGLSNITLGDQWSGESAAMLIDGWHTQNHGDDIGGPGHAGSYAYDSVTGIHTVQGGGSDIWFESDQFFYVHQPLPGNGEIVAKVSSIVNTDPWAKVGVMIRESLDADSKHVMIMVTPENSVAFQYRSETGQPPSFSANPGLTAPYWIKLTRQGGLFTGYRSPDGVSWIQVDSQTISMNAEVYVGLAVTAHNDTVLCTAEFEDVSVAGSFSSAGVLHRTGLSDGNSAVDFVPPHSPTQDTQNPSLTVPLHEMARTAIGFSDDQPQFESLIETNVEEAMLGVNASLWSRIEFKLGDPSTIDELILRMKYDDGYVAYLNGTKVAEDNAPASPQWNSSATEARLDLGPTVFEDIDISAHLSSLQSGTNVLAIHGMNCSPGDADFLILPELIATEPLGEIHGIVWNDLDGDAEKDPGEPGMRGWTVYADLNDDHEWNIGEPLARTDKDGQYALTRLAANTYVLREITEPGWEQTHPGGDGSHEVLVGADQVVSAIYFGNSPSPAEIRGRKWLDFDSDGMRDSGEPALPGWTIFLDLDDDRELDANEPSTLTDEDGDYAFTGLTPWTTYHVCEVQQSGASQTFSSSPFAQDSYGSGSGTHGVATGDFNGDGNVDLATAWYTGYHGVSLLLNGGEGWFYESTRLEAEDGVRHVVAGDFDGDSDLDLAATHYLKNDVSLFRNHGDGSFAAAESFAGGIKILSIAAGDLDGDGDLDLATAGQNGAVLLNEGNGVFGLPVNYAGGTDNSCITAADVDGDADLDLVTERAVLWNSGDGSFVSSSGFSTGDDVRAVTVGDLNGDDALDLAAANNSGKVSVFLNDGHGSLALSDTFDAGSYSAYGAIAVGDLDCDYDLDLVVSTNVSRMIALLFNHGDASFAAPELFDIRRVARAVVMADFNDDARLDVAIGADYTPVLLNTMTTYTVTPAPGEIMTGIDLFNSFLDPPGSISGKKFQDLDADGLKDPGEPGLEGWTIYVDADNNGVLDAGEPSTTTDHNGNYTFPFMMAGRTYIVREVVADGWFQTLPAQPAASYWVDVGIDEHVTGIDFGNRLALVSVGDLSLAEGDSGTTVFEFTVSLSESTPLTVTVDYSTSNDTATVADSDYTATSGTLSFAPGEITKTIVVEVYGDVKIEPDETFSVNLENAVNASIADGQGVGTILDDDFAAQIVVGSPANISAAIGAAFAFDVQYDTTDGDNTLGGLGLRLHYDSSVMSFEGLRNVLPTSLLQQQPPADDTDDYDDDPVTDKFVLISWFDLSVQWPNQPLPVRLLTADFTPNTGLEVGTTSQIRFSSSSSLPTHVFQSQPVEVVVNRAADLDADGNGTANALTDGILIMRYLFGFSGSALTENALAADATWTDPADVAAFLDDGRATMLDVDANGAADALTDGILVLRYLFGFSGAPLVEDALAPDATRTDPAEIAAFLDSFLPAEAKGLDALPALPSQAQTKSASATFGKAPKDGNRQIVTPDPQQQSVAPGNPVGFGVSYATDPADSTLTGLGLRIHYDSTAMTFHGAGGVLQTSIFHQQPPTDDVDDLDDDPQTDKFVLIAWLDITGHWPGQSSEVLLAANFTTLPTSSGSTSVNFSASSTAAGWQFDSTSARIDFGLPEVVGRHVFYNHSAFDDHDAGANQQDDDAIATDKQALVPGQTAAFANYTSYDCGINGMMVDVAHLPPPADPMDETCYFHFAVGNDADPASWGDAPTPREATVQPGAGVDGSTRITIVWDDHAIENQWLQVTVLANQYTGLTDPDVFYFGNAVAESGNSGGDARVGAIDALLARNNPRTLVDPAEIDFPYDFNRDRRVNAADLLLARNNQTHWLDALELLAMPGGKAGGGEQSPVKTDRSNVALPDFGIPFFVSYPGGTVKTVVGRQTQFLPPVAPAEYQLVRQEWDFDGDGVGDAETERMEPVHFVYAKAGEYVARFAAESLCGERAEGSVNVTVFDTEAELIASETGGPAELAAELSGTVKQADGVQDVYALMISSNGWPHLDYMIDFYEILTREFRVDPEKITYLIVGDEIPAAYEEIIDGIATKEAFTDAMVDLGGRVDLDDVLLTNINCHGRGYLGYTPESPYNAALHGYCDVQPLVNQVGNADEFDFRESEYELSLFCGGGARQGYDLPFWDFHAGLGQWLTYWLAPTRVQRWMFLSHYEDMYVEGLGLLSDHDEDIDQFTDYTLGDYDHDGTIDIEAGEVWDFDGDGIPPYDRYTGVFDEDDWGEIDELTEDRRYFHSPLIGIPYQIFDHDLDNRVDIDVYPLPDGPLEVDGTDLDNNGCIDGIDLNDDGDMDDWVAVNETTCLWRDEITDDEVAEIFNPIACGAKVFITNTCHSGGFVNDLSGPETIVITGSLEIGVASSGFLPGLLNEALSTYWYEADVDGNAEVSIMEAYNHAGEHPHVQCTAGMDLFQYDDNGDRVPHRYPLPDGGDGNFGAAVYLAQQDNGLPVVTILTDESYVSESSSSEFIVWRRGPTEPALAVQYAIGGTATSGVDYQPLSGSVEIPAGMQSASILLTLIDDIECHEGYETVELTLESDPTYAIGFDDTASVKIYDSDQPGAIRGSKFNDLDGDGRWDDGEPGLAGWTITLDVDGDGAWEHSTQTGLDGSYAFSDVALGSCLVGELPRPGWEQTCPEDRGRREFLVKGSANGTPSECDVVAAGDGRFVIVWQYFGLDGDGSGIFAQMYHADGTPPGGEFQVNSHTAGDQRAPSIAMAESGRFVVVWGSWGQDGSETGVFAQRYHADGTRDGEEFQVNTYTAGRQEYPAVAMDAAGRFVVAWQSNGQDGEGRGIYAQSYHADGTPNGSEFRVNTCTWNEQRDPSVAIADTGDFVIAWESAYQDGDVTGVYAQRYRADGTPDGGEFRVNTQTTGWQNDPAAAMDAAGHCVIAWESSDQDGSGYGVYAQRYAADGTPDGGEFQVNTYTTDFQEEPSVAMNAAGNLVIAWVSTGQDGSGRGIYAQIYHPDGTPDGREFQVNSYTWADQNGPAAAMDGSANCVVAWRGSADWRNSGYGVLARQFMASGVDRVHNVILTSGQTVEDVNFGNREVVPEVTGRWVFYNNSAFDQPDEDPAIALDKVALRPGETATLANYTSYSRGINGLIVDIAHAPGAPTVADFEFRVGNDDDPEGPGWSKAPDPDSVTVSPGQAPGGSDRVTIVWSDDAITNQWLQVTVLANETTGLAENDVFYFGNAIGETGNSGSDARVHAVDVLLARNNLRTLVDPAPIDFPYDFNRDQRVNATDMLLARNHQTHLLDALKLIRVPGENDQARMTNDEVRVGSDAAACWSWPLWLDDFQEDDRQARLVSEDALLEGALQNLFVSDS